jgi:transposase
MANEQSRQEQPSAPRRTFDEAFKRDAVGLLLQGEKTLAQLARELGVDPKSLREWRQRLGPPPPVRRTEQLEAELRALRRENDSLRAQRDILKKTLGILVEPPPNATRA